MLKRLLPNYKIVERHYQQVELLQADITKLHVDAIVNAANSSLLGGGGVDGAIHRAAGRELAQACRLLGGCKTGDAKATPGFQLPAKFVFHTVGPVWQQGEDDAADKLAACYQRCMQLATDYSIASIAFPAISCGRYKFPPKQAADIAVKTIAPLLSGPA